MRTKNDLTGLDFGRLTVIEKTGGRKNGQIIYKCRCTCGEECEVASYNLRKGFTKSCGCLSKERAKEMMLDSSFQKSSKDWKRENDWVEGTSLSGITKKIQSNNKSGVKGVFWSNRDKRWIAHLGLRGQSKHRSSHLNKQDAINARKEAEDKYFEPLLDRYVKEEVNAD